MPNRTMATRSDQCKGGKLAKERLTVLLTVNATGEEVLEPLVIGKSKMPRCFNKVLPHNVSWRNNKKSWMTSAIFSDYLTSLNTRLQQLNRNILLFLDNAPVHPSVVLSNIKLQFFPANTTAATQPLDAGIIRSFKCRYRRLLLYYLLNNDANTEDTSAILKAITVTHSIDWIVAAWQSVTKEAIRNCWRHVGFDFLFDNSEDALDFVDGLDIAQLGDLANEFDIADPVIEENLDTFDTVDNDWENQLLKVSASEEDAMESSEDDESTKEPVPSFGEMKRQWHRFYNSYQYHQLADPEMVNSLRYIDTKILLSSSKRLKSSLITEYFPSSDSSFDTV